MPSMEALPLQPLPLQPLPHQLPVNPSAPCSHPYQHPMHGFNNSFMLNPYHSGMSVNLHLGNSMLPLPSLAIMLEHGETHSGI